MKLALALLTVLLITTPTAAAKGVASAEICGAEGCRALDPHGALDLNSLVPYGTPVDAPRRLPFYRLRLAFAGPEVSLLEHRSEGPAEVTDIIYVPAERAAGITPSEGLRAERAWWVLAKPSLRTFRRATAGLKPFPPTEERAGNRPIARTAERPIHDRTDEGALPVAPGALALLALAGATLLARRKGRGGGPAEKPRRHHPEGRHH